jgi:hypothetical protein
LIASELLIARLRHQQLTESKLRKAAPVVAALCAMQAQDYLGAKWAIGLRAPGVQDGVDEGSIVRTHVLRPTWHFVTPEDIRWLIALTAPRIHAANAYYYRQADLDAKVFAKSCAMMHRALDGGKAMTRAELAEHLKRAHIPAEGLKLAYLMMHAELEGVICSGPRRGKQSTYMLLDERAPQKKKTPPREEALAELAKRYFTSHGPATVKDFAWWSGLTIAEAQAAVTEVRPRLESTTIGGLTHWNADTSPTRSHHGSSAYLLPNYDEYLIGYKDRAPVVDEARAANIVARSNGGFANHLILDGRLAGSWSRTLKSNAVLIEVAPYKKLTPPQIRAISGAADCHGEFLGVPASMVVV